MFKDQIEDYSVNMNDDIISIIESIDFSNINTKYNSSVKINDKIVSCINRMNYIQYRRKLKKMFSYDNFFVFKEEKQK